MAVDRARQAGEDRAPSGPGSPRRWWRGRRQRLELDSLAWVLPPSGTSREALAEGLITGTILGGYRFERFLSRDPESSRPPPRTRVADPARRRADSRAGGRGGARSAPTAQNRARDLQSLPANVATPSYLAERAGGDRRRPRRRSAIEVLGREQIAAKGMGGLAR